jgi:hypothetical protein
MKHLWFLLVALFVACQWVTPPPSPPVSGGGTTAAGGSISGGTSSSAPDAVGGWLPIGRGGSQATGGSAPTGGTVSTGGSSIDWLACATTERQIGRQHHVVSGWHRNPHRAMHARWRPSYSIVAASSFPEPNLATPLDQGSLGSCTGNGTAQCLSTWPFAGKLTEADAVKIYHQATLIDSFAGSYPPDDTGSDGASAARAAKLLGYTSYDFAAVDTLQEAQQALQRSSCIIGVDWYEGFSNPQRCGEMQMTGAIEGGHEPQLAFWNAELRIFGIRNSWGPSWGRCRTGKHSSECGYAYWSAGTLQKLLDTGGEIDCPVMQ